MSDSAIRIVSIYPSLLGTYGDGGNVLALQHRGRIHGISTEVLEIAPGSAIPVEADLYVLGGGEDTAQVAAADALRADGGLVEAVGKGAAVLAICAGYQLIGEYFPDATGAASPGVGLLDIRTDRLAKRAVGELLAAPSPSAPKLLTVPLTGYENHAGATHLGPQALPLAQVELGVGNGDGSEGAIAGRVIGTYLHGPCLARNPQLADMLLGWATNRILEPVVEQEVEDLRAERLAFVRRNG
jgi:CobQ-like glutamine amidotransferase family enzyme